MFSRQVECEGWIFVVTRALWAQSSRARPLFSILQFCFLKSTHLHSIPIPYYCSLFPQDVVFWVPAHTPLPPAPPPPSHLCPARTPGGREQARRQRGPRGGVPRWRLGNGVRRRGGPEPGQRGVSGAGLPARPNLGAQRQVWGGTRLVGSHLAHLTNGRGLL